MEILINWMHETKTVRDLEPILLFSLSDTWVGVYTTMLSCCLTQLSKYQKSKFRTKKSLKTFRKMQWVYSGLIMEKDWVLEDMKRLLYSTHVSFQDVLRYLTSSSDTSPVRILVRIGPPYPHACRKRRLHDWGGPSDETGKTEVLCHSRCGTIKIPFCSKALSAEHRPKFYSPSPAMVTSPCKWKILERDVKQ
jgi:hypothetical protein